jgi:cellulose synthase/poly-beta-1,6-N-acetylglucosamine synthase-like glycosyltransferase
MDAAAILFWICAGVILYTYFGYALLISLFVAVRSKADSVSSPGETEPGVTLIIPCFNELDVLASKLDNCRKLDYPKDKLKLLFVTDGSSDGSANWLNSQEGITVLHEDSRKGKAAAMNRAMHVVHDPVVIFCDANTMLNRSAVRTIVQHYHDERTGAVAGEKRVISRSSDSASASGEGLYWKYESWLKRLDSDFHSTIGGAGELVSFRTALYTPLEHDTILDDFMQSMRIAIKGYRVVYEPNAYAEETASANIREELKRKVRISAGAWQAMMRLGKAFNPFHDLRLAFTFISHKVFRWTLAPVALLALIPLNYYLHHTQDGLFTLLWFAQLAFYAFAVLGWTLENTRTRLKLFFLPYYFFITNWSMVLGFFRFISGGQSVQWERAKRA